MINVYINSVLRTPRDGFQVNFTYNEKLNTAVLVIPHSEELNLKRHDHVQLLGNGGYSLSMIVAGFEKENDTFSTPFYYTYTIQLVSATVLLQEPMPNISITQPIMTTTPKRTIYDELVRLMTISGLGFTFSTKIISKTNSVICPEMQWNRKTLYEIYTDLLLVVGCIISMSSYTEVSCIDLNETATEVGTGTITYLKEVHPAEEYATELEMNAENTVGDNTTTKSQKWLSPRSEDYVLTTDNAVIMLDKPIYYINKVLMRLTTNHSVTVSYLIDGDDTAPIPSHTFTTGTYTFDITDFVVENEIYETKLPSRESNSVDLLLSDPYDYKRFFFNYSTGGNTIGNLCYADKLLISNGDPAYINIAMWCFVQKWYDEIVPTYDEGHTYTPYNISTSSSGYGDVRNVRFSVDYVSLNTIRFRTAKQNASSLNKKVLISNQGNSYVDSDALGIVETENVNRIGNPYIMANIKYVDETRLPSSNSYITRNNKKYYLAEYVMQVYRDRIYFTGMFVQDFIRKNLYTGIRSKARFTSISTGNDALLRQDLVESVYSLNTSDETTDLFDLVGFRIWQNLGNPLETIAKVQTSAVSNRVFSLPVSTYKVNDKLLFEFRFKNNRSAGMQVGDTSSLSAYICSDVLYVDDNGEFDTISYLFAYPLSRTSTNEIAQAKAYPYLIKSNGAYHTVLDPDDVDVAPIDTDRIIGTVTLNAKKDNREIYSVCHQMKFISSNSSVLLHDNFLKYLPFLIKESKASDVYAFISSHTHTSSENTVGGTFYKELYQDSLELGLIYTTDNYLRCLINEFKSYETVSEQILSWGLCNANNEILFVVNVSSYASISTLYISRKE